MTKRIYTAHKNSGGTRELSEFITTIKNLMYTWDQLDYIDSYESLTNDDSELIKINSDFYATLSRYINVIQVKKLSTVDDYLNYDIEREPDRMVNNSMYRFNNQFTVNRKTARHYETKSTLTGRSLTNSAKVSMGMDELWSAVNQGTNQSVDRNDVSYYGQAGDDSTSLLV